MPSGVFNYSLFWTRSLGSNCCFISLALMIKNKRNWPKVTITNIIKTGCENSIGQKPVQNNTMLHPGTLEIYKSKTWHKVISYREVCFTFYGYEQVQKHSNSHLVLEFGSCPSNSGSTWNYWTPENRKHEIKRMGFCPLILVGFWPTKYLTCFHLVAKRHSWEINIVTEHELLKLCRIWKVSFHWGYPVS